MLNDVSSCYMTTVSHRFRQQTGFTLVELLVGMTLGLLLLTGLAALMARSSSTFQEVQKSSALTDNGRYVINYVGDALNHAGFWGHYAHDEAFSGLPSTPCSLPLDETNPVDIMALPIQGYEGAGSDPTGGCLSHYLANTDVLVIRRLDTPRTAPRDLQNAFYYLQTDDTGENYLLKKAAATCEENKALFNLTTSAPEPSALVNEQPNPPPNGFASWTEYLGCFDADTSLDIWPFAVEIFFISSCDKCSPNDGIPTLKRRYFGTEPGDDGNITPAFVTGTVARGVENMQLFFAFDTDDDREPEAAATIKPSAVNNSEWTQAAVSEIYFLMRSEKEVSGYTDDKSYLLGPNPAVTNDWIAAQNDGYMRRVFRVQMRLNNPLDRRPNESNSNPEQEAME